MSYRSRRLVELARETFVQLPKHESTKGTTKGEQEVLLQYIASNLDAFNDIAKTLSPVVSLQNDIIINHHDFDDILSEPDMTPEDYISPRDPNSDDENEKNNDSQKSGETREKTENNEEDIKEPEEPYMSSGSEFIPNSSSTSSIDSDDTKKNDEHNDLRRKSKKVAKKKREKIKQMSERARKNIDEFDILSGNKCGPNSPSTSSVDSDDTKKNDEHNDLRRKSKKVAKKKREKIKQMSEMARKNIDEFDILSGNKCEPNSPSTSSVDSDDTKKNNRQNLKKQRRNKKCVEKKKPEVEEMTKRARSGNESDGGEEILIDSSKKSDGKRIRDKGHECYYCNKILGNLARHYELMHSNELEVARILALPKNSKRRRDAFGDLLKVADFYHNCNVLATKKGELILVRRPTEEEKLTLSVSDYGPCPDCLGFLLKKRLWYHVRYSCKANGKKIVDENKKRSYIGESNALIAGIKRGIFSKEFNENIVSKLRDDDIGKICQSDETILKFGFFQFEKHGMTQNELIRQSMRQLSRLLIELRKLDTEIKNFGDSIKDPKQFDNIVAATKSLCVSMTSSTLKPQFEIPSLALKIGHSVQKCVAIQRGDALRRGDTKGNKACLSFLDLFKMEWSTRVSSAALSTLNRRKFNTTQLLPLTEDLIKLTKYLNDKIQLYKERLEKKATPERWRKLATCVLSRIILFNKRRSGEAAKITLEQYQSRPDFTQQCTQEMRNSLSELEQELANRMQIIDTEGKRGRRVPVLLTPDVKRSIDTLIKTRSQIDCMEKENPYIFARSRGVGHLRGHDCLRFVTEDADLKCPSYITGTKLRKYIATVSQLLNLQENETDWLARHLGHDIRVHRDFYRLHESAVEATKVSRLLIAVENGEIERNIGRNLNEIELTDLPHLEEESEEEFVEEGTKNATISSETPEVHGQNPSVSSKREKPHEVKKTKKTTKKVPWSNTETQAVLKHFRQAMKTASVPGKTACEECIQQNIVLNRRKWTDVKFHVKNHIDKMRKQTKK